MGAYLAATGATQTQLADHLGITQSMISRRLQGRYRFPLDELPLIASFFGITVEDLLGEVEPQVTRGKHSVSPAPHGRVRQQSEAGPARDHAEHTKTSAPAGSPRSTRRRERATTKAAS